MISQKEHTSCVGAGFAKGSLASSLSPLTLPGPMKPGALISTRQPAGCFSVNLKNVFLKRSLIPISNARFLPPRYAATGQTLQTQFARRHPLRTLFTGHLTLYPAMLVLVIYDIPDNKRRTKLATFLEGTVAGCKKVRLSVFSLWRR